MNCKSGWRQRLPARRTLRLLGLTGTAALLVVSCVALRQYTALSVPMIPGATFVGSDSCSACHEKETRNFKRTVHARLFIEEAAGIGDASCEACHGPGSKHADVEGKNGAFIINPRNSSGACFACHMDKEADFNLPYHHPVPEGRMSCVDCHDPHGHNGKKPAGVLMARNTTDTCAQCHREQSAKHVFEHESLREGCTECHSVHGSINKKMLVQNDNSLCLKCHSQVQAGAGTVYIGNSNHPTRINTKTCWAAGCHDAVHGSNINSHLRY